MKHNNLHVELTPELLKKAQERIDFIAKDGCTKNGALEEVDTNSKPAWYDEARFKRGQAVIYEHYTASANASACGMLLFLQLPVGLVPLLATGKSKDSVALFKRYFSAAEYMEEWFYQDVFDPKTRAYKTLSITKSLHLDAYKMMNDKISVFGFAKNVLKQKHPSIKDEEIEQYIRNKERVWVSQYDMVLMQFAFFGCLVLEPKKCGLHNGDKELIEDFLYMWKVFSWRLGIDSKYSLVEEIDYDLVYAMCKLLLEQEYLLYMNELGAPEGLRMSECIITVFSDLLMGAMHCNVFLRYWYNVLNANSYKLNRQSYEHNDLNLFKTSIKNQLTDDEKKEMMKNNYNDKYIVTDSSLPFEKLKLNGLKQRILYKFLQFAIDNVLKYKLGRSLSRTVVKSGIVKMRKNKRKIMNKLDKKTVNNRFQFSECPFAVKVDRKAEK